MGDKGREEDGADSVGIEATEGDPKQTAPPEAGVAPEASGFVPLSWGYALRGALGVGLVFAFVGFLIGLRSVAIATLPHILRPGDGLDFQELAGGLPIPRLLDWNLTQIEWLQMLRELHPVLCVVFGVLLLGALWLCAISVLNPTFRLFHVSPQRHPKTTSPDERTPSTPLLVGLLLAQQVQDPPAPQGEVGRDMVFTDAASVCIQGHIPHIMQTVLYPQCRRMVRSTCRAFPERLLR